MKIATAPLLLLTSLLSMNAAFNVAIASDDEAKALHEKNCMRCHDNSIYTRSNSIIHSYPELQARVEFCDGAAGSHWSDQQINQVINYLNDKFYKFPKP